jgi:hypothetical protein
MSDKKQPGAFGKTVKLFLLIFVVLLVPVGMDQAGLDRETVKMVGRVAAGITVVLCLWGLFKKTLRGLGIVVLVMIGLVFLMSEGHVQAPRLFGQDSAGK